MHEYGVINDRRIASLQDGLREREREETSRMLTCSLLVTQTLQLLSLLAGFIMVSVTSNMNSRP